jgi:hypothetical protein
MVKQLHLGDEVELTTDRFESDGVARGAIGVITDDWADGSNDVEIHDRDSGDLIAKVRAADGEIRLYAGPLEMNEPRKHGILFGRGDALGPDVEEPPMGNSPFSFPIAGANPAPIAFYNPPTEEVTIEGDVPWELQDEPQTEPKII